MSGDFADTHGLTEKNWGQQWIMVWFQEESVSKQADMLCSSLLRNIHGTPQIGHFLYVLIAEAQAVTCVDIEVSSPTRVANTAWTHISRGVTQWARQPSEFPPEVEGMDAVFVDGGNAVDHPTFPVYQRYFHLIVIQEDCQAVETRCVLHCCESDGQSRWLWRNPPYKNTWKHFQDTALWCNLKLAQQRGLQFYQTRSNAVILYDTLLAKFVEKAICVKTKDQLYQRESVILRPRVVLRANSQSGSQDLLVQGARSSWESQQDAESYGKPEATLLTMEYPVFRPQRWNCRMHSDKTTSQNLLRCSKNIGKRNSSLKTWVKSRRSTNSARNHNKYSKIWT